MIMYQIILNMVASISQKNGKQFFNCPEKKELSISFEKKWL